MFVSGLQISTPTTQELAGLNLDQDNTASPSALPCAQKQKPNTQFEVTCM